MKKCTHCQKLKFDKAFHVQKTTKDGLYYICRECNSEIRREKYDLKKKIAEEKKRL